MIKEGSILLRIKHLQEGTSRVTIMPTANLVDFVDQDQGILGTHTLESLNDLPG